MSVRVYKRLVVGLHHSAPDRATVRLAAEFAGMMRLDLFGLFIEDPGTAGYAAGSGVREFQLLGRSWRPLDQESWSRDIELCASSTRRMLADAATALGVQSRFEIVRAAVGEALGPVSGASDIVIIVEPQNPAERTIAPFPQLVRAVFASRATVLFVPRRIARTRGPVVAIAKTIDDPAVGIAASIAAAAMEDLIVVEAYEDQSTADPAVADVLSAAGKSVRRLKITRTALGDARFLSNVIQGLNERMIVVARGALAEESGAKYAELASLRSVPLLLAGPAAAEESEAA